MKKKLLLLLLFAIFSFNGWTQSISFTSFPTTSEIGTTLTVNYKYTVATPGQIACNVNLLDNWAYVSFVGGDYLNSAAAGTDVTGTFNILIPTSTTPTANLTGLQNYKINIELKDASGVWLAGDYPATPLNFIAATAVTPSISVTSIPTSTQVGTNLVVNYKYTAAAAGKVSIVVTKNGGVNPWDHISTVVYDELNPAVSGTDVTGTFTVLIPNVTTATSALTGNENYSVTLELKDASDNWLAGDSTQQNYNFTAAPAISFTSVPTTTEVGNVLTVSYKYTALAASKIYCGIKLLNDNTDVSFVGGEGLDPAVAGTDVTGSFNITIPEGTTPTDSLTGLQNYKINIELRDASDNFLVGAYPATPLNFTPAPLKPAISFTSLPTTTEIGTVLNVNYKYTAVAAGKIYCGISLFNDFTFASFIAGEGLDPAVSGTDVTGAFNITIPNGTLPTAILSGLENYKINIELRDASNNLLAGAYPATQLNFTGNLIYCKGATVATAVGSSSRKFYAALTGGTALAGKIALTTKTFYVTETINSVESTPRVLVSVIINTLPSEVIGAITSNTSGTAPNTFTAANLAVGPLVGTTTTVSYRVPTFIGSDSYFWTVPAGVCIVGQTAGVTTVLQTGENANVLNVIYCGIGVGEGTIGNITVQAQNASGCKGTARSITIKKSLPKAPAAIKMTDVSLPLVLNAETGVSSAKALTSFAQYMGTSRVITLTATPSLDATSYDWELPMGVTQLSGVNTNEITVDFAGVTSANTFNYDTTAATPVSTNVMRIGVKSRNGVGVSTTSNATAALPATTSTAKLITLKGVKPATPALKMYDLTVSTTVAITDISKYIGKNTELTLIGTVAASSVASSFSWELPSSVNVVAGSNLTSNSIKVNLLNVTAGTASLYLGIKAVNGLGSSVKNNSSLVPATTSTATLLKVTAALPAAAGVVVGSLAICSNAASSVTYTITTAAAKSNFYNVTAPEGCTILGGIANTALVNATSGATFTVNYPVGFTSTTTAKKTIVIQSVNGFGVSLTNKVLSLTSNTCATTNRIAKVVKVEEEFNVVAYPNPSFDLFNIEVNSLDEGITTEVQVYDMTGRLVENRQAQSASIQVGSDLSSGIYNVIVNQGNQVKTIRVIKK
jgi:hypothetical protein